MYSKLERNLALDYTLCTGKAPARHRQAKLGGKLLETSRKDRSLTIGNLIDATSMVLLYLDPLVVEITCKKTLHRV